MKGIKLNKIKLNFKYKNLKELSEVTGLLYKDSTNSRKKIIKELECYLKLEKDGRGYIITEIYDIPKEKVDKRKGNSGKNENSHKHSTTSYEELEYILLDYISKSKDTIYISNNILASQILTNNNYYFAMKNEKYFNIYLKKNERLSNNTITKDLFENINISCKGIIQTCLKNLNKKYKLKYNYNYILIERVEDLEGNIIDNTRMATEEEIETINITTKNYIENFNKKHEKNIKNLNDVNYLTEELYGKFYNKLNIEVFEALHQHDGTEIKMYFKGYIIKKLDNIDKILEGVNIKQIKEKLNKKFIKNLTNNIKRQINRKKKMIDGYVDDKIEKGDVWGITDDYDREKIAKNKFNYRDILMSKDKYKNEYIDILNFILDINRKDITLEIRNKMKNK
ncbi:hypothetical protein CLOACE_18850 [Clostridium acetireducens DSM 10703]|uniref:Uncharacterized protein n=2 Tax=Clostridium TaxID=1485 RepID=A0A1E8EWW1_9CLOT|nr:hypothetical protein CLOACE_18850 [Clostridium acetireducens DSM 10703]